MAQWQEWSSGWIREGHFIQYDVSGVTYYERVLHRDLAHYEWQWTLADGLTHTIAANSESGPVTPDELVVTRAYDKGAKINYLWQVIFGIKSQVLIYIELPSQTHRHGIPKVSKPSADNRRVSHFTEEMSAYLEPTFITEHIMMKLGGIDRITLSAFNPEAITLTPWLNFYINMMEAERVGIERNGVLTPSDDRWQDALIKLYRGTIPCRPLTTYAVTAPAAED